MNKQLLPRLAAPALLVALAGAVHGDVQHGALRVVENDAGNTFASVSVSRVGGDGPWTVVGDTGVAGTSNSRGDYFVDFGTGADISTGWLITSVYQLERTEPSVIQAPFHATPSYDRNAASNRWFVCMHASPRGNNNADGFEVNFDASLAFFPISDGWIGGAFYNAANNGPLTAAAATYVGTPGLERRTEATLTGTGVEVIDFTIGGLANGFYGVSVQGVDLRRDGIILTCGAKNEDNRAQVFANFDGTAIINCIDNESESGGENDPAAFVFIPENTPGVVAGQISGCGKKLFRMGDFNVQMVNQPAQNGTYRLTIPGESPATGTVLLCAHSELAGTTVDNDVFVQPDGDGWLLTTRDIEPLVFTGGVATGGTALQDLSSADVIFHFAFFKNGVAIRPGTPSRSYLTRLNEVVSSRFAITEVTPDNGLGDVSTARSGGSDTLDVYGDNRGDFAVSWLNARLAARNRGPNSSAGPDNLEGVMLPVATEFFRDNTATGGVSGWTTASFDDGEVRLHNASVAGGEINSNFGVAFFPRGFGLTQDADLPGDEFGLASVSVPGGASVDTGVLMAVNWENVNSVVTVTPAGSQFDITWFDGATGLQLLAAGNFFGYVHFPYTIPGLVAGRVSATGEAVNGTANFTLASSVHPSFGFPLTTIAIPGVNATTDGILLVTSNDAGVSVAAEARADGLFQVAGLNLATGAPGQSAFSFVYVPNSGFGASTVCRADFNGDTFVDPDDLSDFIACYFEAPPCSRADFNGDTFVDPDDLSDFIATFFSGGC